MIKLAIFDMDGVITETSHYHFLAWQALANSIDIVIDETFNEQLKGVSRRESLMRILRHGNMENQFSESQIEQLMKDKNEHYKSLIAAVTSKDLLEGIHDVFTILKDKKIPIAIGSASKNAPYLVERLGIASMVDYIVDPAPLKGKPAPDIFLKAAEHFNVDVKECIGIEDAQAGVQAIKSAGMFAVGIGDKEILDQADIVFSRPVEGLLFFVRINNK